MTATATPTIPSTAERGSRLSVTQPERRHVPKRSGKPDPTAHLSAEQVEALGRELDALRQEVLDSRGTADAAYIRKVIKVQRTLDLGSRIVLLFSIFPPAWVAGTAGLSVAKILENMELGHNIMHGQWDWMRDPKIHSQVYEWDHASPSAQWKRSHNEIHHTFTNVLGRDNDLGYGIMRVDEDQRWSPSNLGQPLWNLVNAAIFEYGIAAYDLELGSRAVLLVSMFPPAWFVGTAGLSLAKILENMEIGHNILHGQWDWMRDPKIHSTTWEWDMASPAAQWKHSHNELHHTYTNVIGKDNDLGYGIMRVDED